jgi:hypothetical protein
VEELSSSVSMWDEYFLVPMLLAMKTNLQATNIIGIIDRDKHGI